MHRFSAFWHMRLSHRLQGQKSKSRGGAGAYCGGDLAAQLVINAVVTCCKCTGLRRRVGVGPKSSVRKINWTVQKSRLMEPSSGLGTELVILIRGISLWLTRLIVIKLLLLLRDWISNVGSARREDVSQPIHYFTKYLSVITVMPREFVPLWKIDFFDIFPQIVTKLSPLQQLSSYVFLPRALCQLKFPKRKNWADLLPLFDV